MDDSFKRDGVAGCSALLPASETNIAGGAALPELLEAVDELKKAFMLQACTNEQLLRYECARTKKILCLCFFRSLSLSLSL